VLCYSFATVSNKNDSKRGRRIDGVGANFPWNINKIAKTQKDKNTLSDSYGIGRIGPPLLSSFEWQAILHPFGCL